MLLLYDANIRYFGGEMQVKRFDYLQNDIHIKRCGSFSFEKESGDCLWFEYCGPLIKIIGWIV